ncbi:MAG: aminotransferase class I/II-fold pyridoxal phosphate-dependent enzyme [Flavobacteriaceae bacterium]|nr:aminotransferase class I/II-fold pyridoxal phosphate-dependent enzyme [Flavobacteriaceae bacterium]
MSLNTKGVNTICTHEGELKDNTYKGAVSPLYMSTSYDFLDVDSKRYPRYFNTPNQVSLSKKVAALEHAESAMIFSSGMAAISSTLLTFLKSGDHAVVQNDIYGGTRSFIESHFKNYGINYSFTKDLTVESFENCIQENTKLIYLETPSNPLLKLVDLFAVAKLAKSQNIITASDNTFASPIVQNPIDLGIDIVMHSATKYFGGHSDITAGAVASSELIMGKIWDLSKDFGGNLSDYTVWLLERSMKTLGIRVKAQQKNARKLASFLDKHSAVQSVFYPGLKSNEYHSLAKIQMKGFGAMMSFELANGYDAEMFLRALKLIKPSMSLAGVESTMLLPYKTSHSLLTESDRLSQGITNQLIRFSVGIETKSDLIHDIKQAISACNSKR